MLRTPPPPHLSSLSMLIYSITTPTHFAITITTTTTPSPLQPVPHVAAHLPELCPAEEAVLACEQERAGEEVLGSGHQDLARFGDHQVAGDEGR